MNKLRMTSLVALAALTGGITGCQTASEHRTETGAIVGGVLGATAGALIDDDNRWRGGAIGAAAGAAVGGGIGYVLDKQKESFDRIEDLEAEKRSVPVYYEAAEPPSEAVPVGAAPPVAPPVPSAETTEALTLTMSSELLFERGSSAISQQGAMKIGEIANVLRQYPDSFVIVKGYTSSEGEDSYNLQLSQRRAEMVKNQLVANRIDASRITALGMGESMPVASNETEAGRIQNRRVEIDVIPRGDVR